MEGIPAVPVAPVAPAPPAFATAHPTCPSCRRPVRMRAAVLTLADGSLAVAASELRRALRVHLSTCDGT